MRIKSYISYSQFDTFKRSPAEYKRIYIDGIRRENKYLDFGTKIAEGLEKRSKRTKDSDVLLARKLIPAPQVAEKEFKIVWGGIPILCRLDGFNRKPEVLIEEYKTGKNGWTQSKADKANQILFYVIAASIALKIPPEKIKAKLHYLETYEDTDGQMHLTGLVKVFQTKRTQIDLVRFYPELKKVWLDIEKLIDELC